ncbi:hypothetical protein P7K49_021149 [Saguinus oedipus]|uniref:Ig-like domain-containing protein n=1 Tax=Saguinus oedipus TaxID=9490 RepID=A0ABQ9USJ7_SAGOE|nr:hypothetical protein P7K49_021149 [Saguinus oedipus]
MVREHFRTGADVEDAHSNPVAACTIDNRVTRVAWLNRSTILYAGNDKWCLDPRVVLLSNTQTQYSIEIQNVDVYDEGPYTCSVQTDNHPKTSRVHLIVQVLLQFLSFSNIFYSEPNILFCDVNSVAPEQWRASSRAGAISQPDPRPLQPETRSSRATKSSPRGSFHWPPCRLRLGKQSGSNTQWEGIVCHIKDSLRRCLKGPVCVSKNPRMLV